MSKSVSEHHVRLVAETAQYETQMKSAAYASRALQVEQGKAAAESQTGSKAASRFGVVAQQAGYQVQDFAVQVAAGQNALVALSQQGSQMLGVFGTTGAIAGAVLTVGILGYRLLQTAKGAEEATVRFKTQNEALKEYIKLARERAQLDDPTAKTRFDTEDAQAAQLAFNKQREKVAILEAAMIREREKIKSGEAGGSLNVFGSLSDALIKEREELVKLGVSNSDAQLVLDKGAAEAAKARFESVAGTVAAEEAARRSAQERFMSARKENAMMEMGKEEKLDYYVREMEFLDSIGARNTEEFEIAKRRAHELGTLLLGQSGEDNLTDAMRREQADKTILGLQSRIPQSLQVNTNASALGGVTGSGTAAETLNIQKGILEGIRSLVMMERMASSDVN